MSSSNQESKSLTVKTIPQYLLDRSAEDEGLKKVLDGVTKPEDIVADAILGGNVNYAFCIRVLGKTIFLKQAPEFVAIFGPDGFPLTSERMQREVNVYKEWNDMLGKDLSEKYLPEIYYFDKSHMVVIMEFLDGFELLDHVLVGATGSYHPNVATCLGDFMGKTHSKTHNSKIDADRQAFLATAFENREMRDIQLEFVFSKCYKEATDEQRAGLTLTDEFLQQVELLKAQYNGDNKHLVLSHGDLHPGSVMVNPEGETKVIDPEFTVYGPPGLDVGSLLSGYCLGAIHQAHVGNEQAVQRIIDGAEAVWQSYSKAMAENGLGDALKDIEVETVGFTVSEVCRTALEFAGGRKWLQFEDEATRASARKASLGLVQACMLARHEGGIALLWKELKVAVASRK